MSDDEELDEEDFEDDDIDDEDWGTGIHAAKVRERTLASLRSVAKKLFRAQPEMRSLMLCVAQYWNDEADDAVHGHVVASPRCTPIWPHVCADTDETAAVAGEVCEYCASDLGGIDLDDNGSAIFAFQAYCHEGGSQDESFAANYSPFAVARRQGEDIEVEVMPVLHRPELDLHTDVDFSIALDGAKPFDDRGKQLFLQACRARDDGPRRVFADYLLEQDDPRGEYMSLALTATLDADARKRRDDLLRTHGWSWIHPLSAAIPRHRATFERGMLAAADVYITEDKLPPWENALAWGSVERLHFLPGSTDFVAAVMQPTLREVGPLTGTGLAKLAQGTWAIETLHVSLRTPAELDLLASCNLPRIKRLVIDDASSVDRLMTSPWWKQLERVTWLGDVDLSSLLQQIGVPWVAIAQRAADGRAAGWEIAVSRAEIEVSYIGWSDANRSELTEALDEQPTLPVVLVPSRFWEPTPDDVAALSVSGRRVALR